MGCVVLLFAMISPRLALALIWLFGVRMERAFDDWWLPVLGFVFLPWTTLAYVMAYAPVRGVEDIGWLVVALGLLLDIGSYRRASERRYRRRALT